ncbi:MAG: hypothetical protein A2046_03755 [Bacteroidetes bacterium GWA2_30_7]|nr:MAG: hypothetical protein A2046_03755 [Bacteroidetes bacterium GWA2_30_7]
MIGGGNHLYHPEGIDMIDFIRKKYKNEIVKNQLQLLGSVKPENIRKYTENAKAVLIPSVVENLPYTVIESMAQGQIVLASIQGGQSEIIDDEVDGFLFDHKKADSFADKLQIINSLSKENEINISKNAYNKIVNNYSYNVIYEQKLKLLNILLDSKNNYTEFPFKSVNSLTVEQKTTNLKLQTSKLLSVVIPYFNMGNYVEETIQSILKSTYRNLEIILVNDGTNEQYSIEKISELEKKYKIQVIHKKNEGLALARNDGAKVANGKFLAFLDPDDTIEPSYYEKAINVLLNKNNVHFVGCWAKYFGEGKGYWATFTTEPPYLLAHNMINSSALIYKTEAFLKSGLNDPKMLYGMEDYESVINMVKNGYKGVALPEPLWNYRVRKNSMARAFTIEKQLYLYRTIAEKHHDIFAKFSSEITSIINTNGAGISFDNPTLRYNLKSFKFINIRLSQYIIERFKKLKVLRKPMIFINKTIFAKNK